MDVKYLNPFVEAASEVLKTEADLTITNGALSLQKSAMTTDDITVLINLVGQIQGVVLFGMPNAVGLGIVSNMMGQVFAELDNLAQSGIAELGNVISGRATVKLAKEDIHSTISTPTLLLGKGVKVSTLDFPRIVVPLHTDLGDIVIHLAVKESPPGEWNSNYVPLIQSIVKQA